MMMCKCDRESTDKPAPGFSDRLPFTENPGDNWEIGYSVGDTLDPSQFRLCTFADTASIIALWHPAKEQPGTYPYTGQNRSSTSQVHASNRWALKPYQVAMEGSNTGQFSMLRFTVPVSAKYRIKVIFEGVHIGLSTTDVHVLKNDQHLFDDNIDGYGGDTTFHPITGQHPSAVYESTLDLQKNDIITFAVGYGSNKTHYNDTTGLLILIEII